MAAQHGKGARIKFFHAGTSVQQTFDDSTNWTLNMDGGLVDVNVHGENYNRSVAGRRGFTGSIDFALDFDGTTQGTLLQSAFLAGTVSTAHMYFHAATSTISARCWLESAVVNAPANDLLTGSITFRSDGTISDVAVGAA